jgi:hypothetical protein
MPEQGRNTRKDWLKGAVKGKAVIERGLALGLIPSTKSNYNKPTTKQNKTLILSV